MLGRLTNSLKKAIKRAWSGDEGAFYKVTFIQNGRARTFIRKGISETLRTRDRLERNKAISSVSFQKLPSSVVGRKKFDQAGPS